ncbi:MAG: hypothetical protein HOP31_00090 [Ignavibacteria bacterium]|nr:hypothetical protein [Ignavibacteria bacterium]
MNRLPNVAPPGGTLPDGSIVTWVAGTPPEAGHINVTGATGNIHTLNGREYFTINFTHENTKNPFFHVVPPQGPDYWLGGENTPPLPPSFTFVNKDSAQTYSTGGGTVSILLTVNP